MKIIPLYESMLKSVGLSADKDGFIEMKLGKGSKQVTVGGKPLVLPIDAQLKNGDWSNRVAYHPLMENILKGESDVLSKMRSCANLKLNYVIGALTYEMLVLGASVDQHQKLNPSQSEFLAITKNADDKTIQDFKSILEAMPAGSAKQAFVNIYLKRGGSVKGQKHSRVGIVSFPLYEELTRADYDKTVFGVKVRVKDRPIFIGMMEYMFPRIAESEAFNFGSDSKVAPYVEAFMRAFGNVAGPINDLVDNFRNVLLDPEACEFDAEWVEAFENLDTMSAQIRMIPKLDGNEGTESKAPSATPSAQSVQMTAGQQPIAPAASAPAAAAAPQGNLNLPWSTVPGTAPQVQTHQPAVGSHLQQQNNTMGNHLQQQPIAHASPVSTGRGLDFEALCRSNPALAAQTGSFNTVFPPTNQMGNNAPRWASPGFGQQQQPMGYNQYPVMGGGTSI